MWHSTQGFTKTRLPADQQEKVLEKKIWLQTWTAARTAGGLSRMYALITLRGTVRRNIGRLPSDPSLKKVSSLV